MPLNRNKLYSILIIACAAGYIWLIYGINKINPENNIVEVCLIKHVTNIPCPSCGSTRSILTMVQGNFLESLYINPMGILIVLIMLITPIWILFDLIKKKNTLFNFYTQTETFLNKPKISIPLILLVLINWIWNITKGL